MAQTNADLILDKLTMVLRLWSGRPGFPTPWPRWARISIIFSSPSFAGWKSVSLMYVSTPTVVAAARGRRADPAARSSPFRVVDQDDRELEWINRFLDMQCVRGLAPLSLRAYANNLLHFVRWWSRRPGVDVTRFTADQFWPGRRHTGRLIPGQATPPAWPE